MHIADLHCDLLSYLGKASGRTPYDPESRSSFPQLQQGGVAFQTFAIFTETKEGSQSEAARQFSIFQKLEKQFPLTAALALENASGLLEESEKIELCFDRLEKMLPLLYVSLTWNSDNRFGGGNETKNGLKRDGEALLDFLSQKKIAIDLSHTSDWLAHDIIHYIDKKGLSIRLIASHSNFRSITNVPRNLPDEIATEIIRRGGLIGLNFVRKFVGVDPSYFLKHLEHGLSLSGESALAFGADFFTELDTPAHRSHLKPFFFDNFGNASCYPQLLNLFRSHFPETLLQKLAHNNLKQFIACAAPLSHLADFLCSDEGI